MGFIQFLSVISTTRFLSFALNSVTEETRNSLHAQLPGDRR